MNRIYFDNAATTRTRREVIETMLPYFDERYGNPAGTHSYSREAAKVVEESRETIAEIIGAADPGEIIFTSGGTEANNLAIQGFIRKRNNKEDHIISSRVEHVSVLNPCKQLELEGYEFNTLEVDSEGKVYNDDFAVLINPGTVLASIMHGNNEIGTIQPLKEYSEILKSRGIVFHTDAVQTMGKIPFNVKELGVDMATFSAHKLYGPKGIGALYIKKSLSVQPILFGGGQEYNLRSGTINVGAVAGFAMALKLAVSEMEETTKKLHTLQNYIIESLKDVEEVYLNGPADIKNRLPGNINFCVGSMSSLSLIRALDSKGIAVSGGSACSSGGKDLSHVLKAIGIPVNKNLGSIRISTGKYNTEEECQYFVEEFKNTIKNLRKRDYI